MENCTIQHAVKPEEKHSLVPSSWAGNVRTIKMKESKAAGLSLALSFADDHLSHYLLDGEDMKDFSAEARWKLHVSLMTTVVASHAHRGIVTAVGADYDALAIWAPPSSDTDGWWTAIRSGIAKLYCQLTPEGRKRYFTEMLPLLTETKAEMLQQRDADSYYLVYIGTKPNARSRGYATKLLQHMIEKADAENKPMYLESSSNDNNRFYRKFGFEVRKKIQLGCGQNPVELDIMVREPVPPKTLSPATSMSRSSDGF